MNSSVGLNKGRNRDQREKRNKQFSHSTITYYLEQSNAANTDLDMSGEEAGEASTFAKLASSLRMAEASEVGLPAEPG